MEDKVIRITEQSYEKVHKIKEKTKIPIKYLVEKAFDLLEKEYENAT